MDSLKQYLHHLVSGSSILEKALIKQKITVLWFLKENINRQEAENFLNEIQKNIKKVITYNIEFKIVDEVEVCKPEITDGV